MYGYNCITIPAHLENFVQNEYDAVSGGFMWTNGERT